MASISTAWSVAPARLAGGAQPRPQGPSRPAESAAVRPAAPALRAAGPALRAAAPAPPDPAAARQFAAAASVLRRHRLRLSSARRLVIEALIVADGPMSAEQIAQGVGGRVPSSDRASVYRNLERLEQIGLVGHVHLGDGPGLYSLTLTGEREYLTCERCGDYRDVDPRELDEVRAQIEARFGYRIRFSHFALAGLCASCVLDAAQRRG
jgi:Fur family ferric uptake transcriptional regulator